jgi:1-aminocyclopropane-1-carboxylate deaminase/D-cysteine desulfhydrase-like pyridoxal-dependent ACC family enzyme
VDAPFADLPRFRLFDGPSPFHRLDRFSAALGGRVDVWIKREDLLPVAFGGNKLRNLEFHVGAALAAGADSLITSGRRWSNHCRLSAAAGAMAGLEVHLVLSGPRVEPPGPGVRLAELFGAHIHWLATADRAERSATIDRLTAELRAAGMRPHVVGVGGSGPVGAAGQVLAGIELADQARAAALVPDLLVVPSATGGTQAGLVVASRLAGTPAGVLGAVVASPETELRPAIESTVAALAAQTGTDAGPDHVVLDSSELGTGYGRPTAAAADAAALLARTEGILVDPIYTAKALALLVARTRSGELDGRTVVFWHAGGTLGLFEPLD